MTASSQEFLSGLRWRGVVSLRLQANGHELEETGQARVDPE
jgi:hypothetical protein